MSQIKILLTTGPFEKLKLDFCLFLKILVLFLFFLFFLCSVKIQPKWKTSNKKIIQRHLSGIGHRLQRLDRILQRNTFQTKDWRNLFLRWARFLGLRNRCPVTWRLLPLPLRRCRCVTGAPLRRSLRHRRGNETVKQRRQRRERFDSNSSNSSNPLKTFFSITWLHSGCFFESRDVCGWLSKLNPCSMCFTLVFYLSSKVSSAIDAVNLCFGACQLRVAWRILLLIENIYNITTYLSILGCQAHKGNVYRVNSHKSLEEDQNMTLFQQLSKADIQTLRHGSNVL